MIAIQRAWADGALVSDIPRTRISLGAVSASGLDYWCNGLWFMSLALSLSVALMAVLVKQWLQVLFVLNRASTGLIVYAGIPKPCIRLAQAALRRQFRPIGVERWNLPLIV